MNQDIPEVLASLVAAGKSLRACIAEAGLPVRETLIELRDKHREKFREAKRVQISARLLLPQRDAKALKILRTDDAEEPIRGR
jgi:hypothetical protein